MGPCRLLNPDDWIGRVGGVLRWGWGGCRCMGVEDDNDNRPGEEIFDPLQISPDPISCIHWHSTSLFHKKFA